MDDIRIDPDVVKEHRDAIEGFVEDTVNFRKNCESGTLVVYVPIGGTPVVFEDHGLPIPEMFTDELTAVWKHAIGLLTPENFNVTYKSPYAYGGFIFPVFMLKGAARYEMHRKVAVTKEDKVASGLAEGHRSAAVRMALDSLNTTIPKLTRINSALVILFDQAQTPGIDPDTTLYAFGPEFKLRYCATLGTLPFQVNSL